MKSLNRISATVAARVLGPAALAWNRIRDARKLRRRRHDPASPLGPPFLAGPRFKELVSRHYLTGQHANAMGRPVAWVTSGAPVEFLVALGYFVHYPENHAAMCGIRRQAVDIMGKAEDAGYSRDVCSYARTDFGSLFSGKTPVGRLPRPDLLVCCNNICQTVVSWYRVLARHTGAELVVIDTPFLYDQATPHAVEYVKAQIAGAMEVAERIARRKLTHRRLVEVGVASKEASELWMQVLEKAWHAPSPMTAFDQFILMGPIVEMRGAWETIRFYQDLNAELEQRIDQGVAAVRDEKVRLIWDNLPIWFRVRKLSEFLAAHGASCVTSTYTNAWGELAPLMDPYNPLESMAKVYLHPILNRSTAYKLDVMKNMAHQYKADGVILHSDRSCKPYSLGQMDQRDRLVNQYGVPALLLEADHSDERVFADGQSEARVSAFLESLAGARP